MHGRHRALLSSRQRIALILSALVLLVGAPALTLAATSSSPALAAVGAYDNAAIADKAATYSGQWGGNACRDAHKLDANGRTVAGYGAGQCRTFVNCVLSMVGRQYPTGTYFQSFLDAGGQEIKTVNQLTKGDIVQSGDGVHTFIIYAAVRDNVFSVVDSNSSGRNDEIVHGGPNDLGHTRPVTLNGSIRAFRMGTVHGGTSIPKPAGGAGDGAVIHAPETGAIYIVAGGSPMYVSSWSAIGGSRPYVNMPQAQIDAMPNTPLDGTVIRGARTGSVYIVAGGSAMHISQWGAVGGPRPYIDVDQSAIDRLPAQPQNNTVIRGAATGAVYIVAGGAPMWVSSWSAVGGPRPFTNVDQASIDRLPPAPTDGTFVRDYSNGAIYKVVSGRAQWVSSMSQVTAPYTNVDHWAIVNKLGVK